jgi:hypothetical protein
MKSTMKRVWVLHRGSGARGAGRPTSMSHHRSGIQSGLFQPFNASRNT